MIFQFCYLNAFLYRLCFFVIDFLIPLVIQGLEYSEIVTVLVVAGKNLLYMSCRRILNLYTYHPHRGSHSGPTNYETGQHA